jgi:hypothetical protein
MRDHQGQPQVLVHPLEAAPGGAGGLALEVDEHRPVLLVEPVLHETRVHTAGLDRDHELRVVLQKLDIVDIVRDGVARLSHILLAVDLPLAPARLLPQLDRPVDRRTVLFGPEVERLALQGREDLHILDEQVALVLCGELRLLPTLRDVIHLSQR